MRMISYLLPFLLVRAFAGEPSPRDFHAGFGEAAVTVLSEETAPDMEGAPGEAAGAPGGSSRYSPVSAIRDFASLREAPPVGEAMLEIYFHDYQNGSKLRFPLKYSELRRFLKQHPAEYQQEDAGERNVALIRDLTARMHIRMKKPNPDNGGMAR